MKRIGFATSCLFFQLLTSGCTEDSSTEPSGSGFSKDNISITHEKEDTIPSIFVQMIPKISGFNQDSSGYVEITVDNRHDFSVDIQAQAEISGYTNTSTRSVTIAPKSKRKIGLFPIFKPGVFAGINELAIGSYSIKVDAMHNGSTISLINETSNAIITARDVIYWSYWDEDTREWLDLSFTIAGWVTPHVPEVDAFIRIAASYHPNNSLVGYQPVGTRDPSVAQNQVNAMWDALKANGVTYINSPVSYPQGTQRVKYPADALKLISANCIDGTVLLAAAMENIGLNPQIILVPGHAFVAWETWDGSNTVGVLETTMISTSTFIEAYNTALVQYNEEISNGNFASGRSQILDIKELRSVGITPLFKRANKKIPKPAPL